MIRISREEWVGRWLRSGKGEVSARDGGGRVSISPHCAAGHFYGILEARVTCGLKFVSISKSAEDVLGVAWHSFGECRWRTELKVCEPDM